MTEDDGREIAVCPECDGAHVKSTNGRGRSRDDNHYCTDCGAGFEEPSRRPPKHPSSRSAKLGLARTLEKLGADDVAPDRKGGR